MKIYRYKNELPLPECVNLGSKYFFDKSKNEVIGFGTNDKSLSNGVVELTEAEYLAHVLAIGFTTEIAKNQLDDKKKQIGEYVAPAAKAIFMGRDVNTQDEINQIVKLKTDALFSDPDRKMEIIDYKEKLMAQIICILLADSGRITYTQTNIKGVVDKKTADEFIVTLLSKWSEAEQIRNNAEQFIKNNNL